MKTVEATGPFDATVTVPGSKSYTQRALVAAALARGSSRLGNCLVAEDTELLAKALISLGARIERSGGDTVVRGTGGLLSLPGEPLFFGNNGTGMRFAVALASLAPGSVVLDGDSRLRERPVKPLVEAVASIGGKCCSLTGGDQLPLVNYGGGLTGGTAVFTDSESSQYVSSLMIAAPYAAGTVTIELRGRVLSRPYIDMTLEVVRRFGASIREEEAGRRFVVAPLRAYRAQNLMIEGDASSASYLFLAAALCRGRVKVAGIGSSSIQGDLGFLTILEELGCVVRRGSDAVEVEGRTLAGGDRTWDLSAMPDMVPGAAVLASFRPGRTVIANVPHLRVKESDRLAAMASQLHAMGIAARELPDGLVITGGTPRGAAIETYNDHRIAMSCAVAGLVTGNMRILNEECVGKSFPDFWKILEVLPS